MAALSKALSDITPTDIRGLIPDWAEDETLEFKQTLSAKNGTDPWLNDQSEVGQAAKHNIFKEVVAFANSYGGDLVLGIGESNTKPPRAASIHLLPKCVELASRLELSAREHIKPQIPLLGVRGVPIEGDAGVVLIRVPKSRLAPHRLEMKGVDKECYRRVSDRSEAMTMREIQDLTFSAARGLDHLQRFIDQAKLEIMNWNVQDIQNKRSAGWSVGAIPQSADLFLEKVHGVAEVQPVGRSFNVRMSTRQTSWFQAYSMNAPYNFRPILRGSQGEGERIHRLNRLQRVGCNGLYVDMARMRVDTPDTPGSRSEYTIYPGWVFASLLGVLESLDRFRGFAAAHAARYALTVTLHATHDCKVAHWTDARYDLAGSIPPGVIQLPTYEVGERATWPALLNLIHTDFWNAIGVAIGSSPEFEFQLRD